MKVYLAVPLVANRDRARAIAMAKAISDSGNELSSPWVLEPYDRHDPSVLNVFERDKRGAEGCDLLVADVSSPSTGVGMEIMAAYLSRRRVIAVTKRGNALSGMVAHMDGRTLVEFDTNDDLYSSLKTALSAVRPEGASAPPSRNHV